MFDDRAVSSAVGYVLSIGIAAFITVGLVTAGTTLVADQRDQTTRTQLDLVGHQVAGTLENADRTVEASDSVSTLEIRRDLPERIVGESYRVDVDSSASPPEVTVSVTDPDMSRTVTVQSATDLADASFTGGPILVSYDSANDELEVTNQ